MTTGSPWTQTVGTLTIAGATLTGTNLKVIEPADILANTLQVVTSGLERVFADAATRGILPDNSIVLILRETARANSRWYRYVTRRLAELSSGKFGTSGMPQPPNSACTRALLVAESLFNTNTPTPSVTPSESGTVLFVWRSQALELEIEIGPEETAVWAYDRPHGEVWSGQLESRRANVSELLALFGPH
jgi:hypothetical protein